MKSARKNTQNPILSDQIHTTFMARLKCDSDYENAAQIAF